VSGLWYWVLSIRANLQLKQEELAAVESELEARSRALAEAEGRIDQLKSIPKAELLPMLKLAHEQRSPLAAIQNALDMLLQGYAANDLQLHNEMLELARERAATMLERVNDFLRLGSVRHAEIERKVQSVQLLDVLERLVAEKRVRSRWKAIDFRTDVPDTLPLVTATPEDMEHLLSNLINNAIKYTDPGGTVTVSLREANGSVVGAVEDTGVGISPRDLPKIFDEFYRAEGAKDIANGSGLGLAIVKRVVDLYGGHLDVESEVGKGSKFSFAFPKGERLAEEERIKTFRDLQEEVVGRGVCGKCDACTAFCSAGKLGALAVGEDGFPHYVDATKCLVCGICYLICPLTTDLDAEVRRRYRWRLPIGAYQSMTSVRATREAVRMTDADGGVMASLLLYLLENYLIQGAVLSRRTTAFGGEPVIAATTKDIVSVASSDSDCSGMDEFKGDATTYSPLLSAVKDLASPNELGNASLSCVALVGTPCQIRTIRKMQCLGVMPAQAIGYTIGLFCMGHLNLDVVGRKKLEDRLDIDLSDVDRLDVAEDLCVSLSDGSTLRVPFDVIGDTARPACLACAEFASDYADISIGGLGSPDGYSTILVRTEKGSRMYNGALSQGYIQERDMGGPTELRSEKTRMVASIVAYARRKREHGEARLKEMGLDVV
jgi:coenzyme F420 hydrogenase subunit beta